jgi:hypothetical protein
MEFEKEEEDCAKKKRKSERAILFLSFAPARISASAHSHSIVICPFLI